MESQFDGCLRLHLSCKEILSPIEVLLNHLILPGTIEYGVDKMYILGKT